MHAFLAVICCCFFHPGYFGVILASTRFFPCILEGWTNVIFWTSCFFFSWVIRNYIIFLGTCLLSLEHGRVSPLSVCGLTSMERSLLFLAACSVRPCFQKQLLTGKSGWAMLLAISLFSVWILIRFISVREYILFVFVSGESIVCVGCSCPKPAFQCWFLGRRRYLLLFTVYLFTIYHGLSLLFLPTRHLSWRSAIPPPSFWYSTDSHIFSNIYFSLAYPWRLLMYREMIQPPFLYQFFVLFYFILGFKWYR